MTSEPDAPTPLAPSEHDRIFQEAIWPMVTAQADASIDGPPRRRQHPGQAWTLWIIAPAGHGKSTVQREIPADVRLDADDFEALHPAYERLALDNDRTARPAIAPDVDKWWDRVVETAQRLNLTMTISGWVPEFAIRMQQAGRRNEVLILTGDEEICLLRTFKRYIDQRRDVGYGGWVPVGGYEEQYHLRVPAIVQDLQQQKLVDALYVYSRDGHLVHTDELLPTGGPRARRSWRDATPAVEILLRGRGEPWSQEEFSEFRTTASELADRLPTDMLHDLRDSVIRAHRRQDLTARAYEAAWEMRRVAVDMDMGPAVRSLQPNAAEADFVEAEALDRSAIRLLQTGALQHRARAGELNDLAGALSEQITRQRPLDFKSEKQHTAAAYEAPEHDDPASPRQVRSI